MEIKRAICGYPWGQEQICALGNKIKEIHAEANAKYPPKFFFGLGNMISANTHINSKMEAFPEQIILNQDMYVIALHYINGMENIGNGALPLISMIIGLARLSPIQTISGLSGLLDTASKHSNFQSSMPAYECLAKVLDNYRMMRTAPAGLILIRSEWDLRILASGAMNRKCNNGLSLDDVVTLT